CAIPRCDPVQPLLTVEVSEVRVYSVQRGPKMPFEGCDTVRRGIILRQRQPAGAQRASVIQGLGDPCVQALGPTKKGIWPAAERRYPRDDHSDRFGVLVLEVPAVVERRGWPTINRLGAKLVDGVDEVDRGLSSCGLIDRLGQARR